MTFVTVIILETFGLTVLSTWYAVRVWKQGRRLMDLRLIAIGAMAYFYLLPGWCAAILPNFDTRSLGTDYDTNTQITLVGALAIAFAGMFIGLTFRWGKPSTSLARSDRVVITYSERLLVAGAAFFAVGTAGIVLQLKQAGGALAVLEGGSQSYIEARLGSNGLGGLLASVLPIGVLCLLLAIPRLRDTPRFLKHLLVFAVVMSGVLMFLLLTVRHNIAIILFGVSILLEMTLPKRSHLLVPALLLSLVLGAGMLQTFRVSSGEDLGFEVGKIAAQYTQLETTAHVLQMTDTDGFLYGQHVLDVVVFAVPRALWPEKPVTSMLNRIYWPRVAASRSEKTPGLVAEGYTTVGLIGVFIFAILFGSIVRAADRWLKVCMTNGTQYLLTATALCGFTYMSVRAGLFGKHLYNSGMMLAQVAAIVHFAQVRLQSAGRKEFYSTRFPFQRRSPSGGTRPWVTD